VLSDSKSGTPVFWDRTHDAARIVGGDRLVEATPEAVRELAESAMLLSQGARRAIEMKRDADNRSADTAAPAFPAPVEVRPPERKQAPL
jgi:hypothetical protein